MVKRFNRGDSFERRDSDRKDSGRRSFGGRDRFERRGRDSERPRMHEVICDKCGEKCEVPFKPTAGKPVYCNECFRKNDRSESRGNSGNSSKDIEQINLKLDKIMKALKIE